jgi:hypothetical protein
MKDIISEYGMLILAAFAGVATVSINMMLFFGPLKEELMMVVSSL